MEGMTVSVPRRMSTLVLGAVTFCLVTLLLTGCAGIPDGVEAVKGFDVNRYLGTWYEIARLDHPFERGLSKVRAEYTLREDGGVNVINMGFDRRKKEWKTATGKAYSCGGSQRGQAEGVFSAPFTVDITSLSWTATIPMRWQAQQEILVDTRAEAGDGGECKGRARGKGQKPGF